MEFYVCRKQFNCKYKFSSLQQRKRATMEINRFKARKYIRQYGYSSFSPEPMNHEWLVNNAKVNRLLNEATRKLGELNAFSTMIPDVDFFIRMHITKEATKSSRIEGTQTSMEEAIQNAEYINHEKHDDCHEVHNYINALKTLKSSGNKQDSRETVSLFLKSI